MGVVESQYISDKQIILNLESITYAFKRNNLELLRFQWQIKKYSLQLLKYIV